MLGFDLQKNKFNPYYIYIPDNSVYTIKSAGARLMYNLCHMLNIKGYKAYILYDHRTSSEYIEIDSQINLNNIQVPVADLNSLKAYIKDNKKPIVIRPIWAPMQTLPQIPVGVYYMAHYQNAFGYNKEKDPNYLYYAYTKKIAEIENINTENVMFAPMADTNFFTLPQNNQKRNGKVVYGAKYKTLGGKFLVGVHDGAIEITRGSKFDQTKEEIKALLQQSEALYVYEDTALINEAHLCGCPVIFIKNEIFSDYSLAYHEMGDYGISYDLAPESIEKAKNSVGKAREIYLETCNNFWNQLDVFIDKTQDFANNKNILPNDYDQLLSYLQKTKIADKLLGKVIRLVKNYAPQWFIIFAKKILRFCTKKP